MSESDVKKNFAYQMIYEVLALILPFITSPYIARVVGAEGLGTYSYSYSVAYYFVLFSLLGIKNYGNRAIAKSRDDQQKLSEAFSNIAAVHILVSVICIVAYISYVLMFAEDRVYAAIQFLYVLSGLFDISWFYFGIEHFKLTVTRDAIIRVLNVICVFVFVHSVKDLWKYCLIAALGNLSSQLVLWIPLRKYVKIVRPRWRKMAIHLKPLLILFIPAVAVSLYKYMDKIMIGFMSSKEHLGYYENAEKVINIPMSIIDSFGTVMLPKMSNLAAGDNKNASLRYISLSMQFVMCLAIGLSFGLAGVGRIFAPIFWGSEFMLSGTLIMGLSCTIPFISFANVIRTQYLIPNALDKQYLSSVIAGAAINLITNALLITKFGSVGAMVGTIAAETVVCIWQAIVVRRKLPVTRFIRGFLPFVPTGIIMFVIVSLIGDEMGQGVVTLIVQVLAGASFYLCFSLICLVKMKNEVVINAISSKRGRIDVSR